MLTLWQKLVQFGFRLLYNEMAWTYDAVSWLVSLGDWRAWQLAALPFVHGRRVLEIGHGPGHMLTALDKAGCQATGLDLSPYMGRQAASRLEKAGVTAPLIRGDTANLPLADAVFDTVLATFPTDYLSDPAVLAEVSRVLVGNGRFIIIPEAHFTGSTFLHRFIEWLYAITGQRSGAYSVDATGRWPVDAVWQPIRRRFTNAGFHTEMEQVQLARSIVTILIAHKHGSG